MIFRLRTSKQTQEIFEELEKRSNFRPFTLVKHAIIWSIKQKTSVANFQSDANGLDLNRQTITGEYDIFFKSLIQQNEGRYLTEEEYFPHYLKAHIDRGAPILLDMYNHGNGLEGYIKHSLGVGDTV
ncbi:DndE family protein [Defluviitalea raffinosedens]|uniref:DndE family protein n=1 Tax=Defluviitalea raffinosedens TaxID=1450156 RepID=UPI00195ACCC0|nr:DndE family protein [Defluviitalea raffinosedens]MBM7685983.1 DNA sulfur modification protein DndE [Defluviitalea raffinosedens]